MNKKGDTQKILLFIFYLLMAFIIIYTLTSYLTNYFNGSEYDKEFISKDLGLAIDTLSLSPNAIQMKYNMSQEFIVENKDSKLNIKLKNSDISRKYIFISKIKDFLIKSNEINIKKDNEIKIT